MIAALVTLATVAYPFLLWLWQGKSVLLITVAFSMGALWLLRAWLERNRGMTSIALSVASLFFVTALLRRSEWMLWYPVTVNLIFLVSFVASLKHTPMIEKFARIRHPNLPSKAKPYLRHLTKIWCGYFVVNTLVTILLILFGSYKQWAVYTGIISYLLMGILFIGEYFYRIFILKPNYDN